MTNHAGLDDILEKLREPGGGGRIVSADEPSDLRAKLLAELDITILPRRLSIRNDIDESISLDVAHRKIMVVGQAKPEKMVTVDKFLGVALSVQDRNSIVALNDLLERFVSKAKQLEIRSEMLDLSTHSSDVGISATDLSAKPVDLSQESKVPDLPEISRVEAFAAEIKPLATAWIILKDQQTLGRYGKSDTVKKLQDFSAAEQASIHRSHQRNYPDVRDIGFAVRSQMTDSAEVFIYGWEDEVEIFAIAQSTAIPKILALWTGR